jgi:hypothetical protein
MFKPGPPDCKTNPALTGNCFSVSGTLFSSNGTPSLRIKMKPEGMVLGVVPPEQEIIPSSLRQMINDNQTVEGKFLVCPFSEPTKDKMREVCIESAEDLVIHSDKK